MQLELVFRNVKISPEATDATVVKGLLTTETENAPTLTNATSALTFAGRMQNVPTQMEATGMVKKYENFLTT